MPSPPDPRLESLLREVAPQVLGQVMRRFRDFAACEDAVQEALLAAAAQWPRDGIPGNPRGWLIQVALRRMTDHVRSETSHGPEAGLELLAPLGGDERLRGSHRLDAVRAHLLERAGDRAAAIGLYRAAAARTTSVPERSYLLMSAARLTGAP